MKFALALGTHALVNFVRLNTAYARKVFGDETPILLYDSPSEQADEIQQVAADYGCAYFRERINKGHFSGDLQAAVCAIAFAKEHGADIGIKLNQRTILLSPEIPALLDREFADPRVTLVTPSRYPAESIADEGSRFHSRFPIAVDFLAFRANAWDAQGVADRYKLQWTTGVSKWDVYSETFWHNESKRLGPAHRTVDWLASHRPNEPFKYLRKIQNTESDYNLAAIQVGLKAGKYQLAEWSKLKPGNYRPSPRA